ncbi:hypothetical protein ABIB35_001494 [Arthrobacter sp. UYP6]|uniref:hypothetical protein n=1 Tax=Arthrobacter sp. UYP6 TaxID=1756378 RepID=UPI003396500E
MADALPLRAAVLAALRSIRGITVYDGYVPDKVPVDAAQYILPYVVFFGGVGDEIPERDLSARVDLGGLRWDIQTTSVGANPDICASVAQTVRRTLTNLPLGTHYLLPNPDGFKQETPIRDTTITPARFMLPAPWRLDTT